MIVFFLRCFEGQCLQTEGHPLDHEDLERRWDLGNLLEMPRTSPTQPLELFCHWRRKEAYAWTPWRSCQGKYYCYNTLVPCVSGISTLLTWLWGFGFRLELYQVMTEPPQTLLFTLKMFKIETKIIGGLLF